MIETLIAIGALTAGLSGVTKAVRDYFKRSKDSSINIQIEGKKGTKLEIPSDTKAEEIARLIEILKKSEDVDLEVKESRLKDESGFIISEFFLYFVPGVIALLFAGTFIFLLITHQESPGYTTPKELSSAMTMIIGYFFGVGVSSAANKGKTLSEEDIRNLLRNEE